GSLLVQRLLQELPTGEPQSAPPVTFVPSAKGIYPIEIRQMRGNNVGMARLPSDTLVASHFTDQDRARVRGHPLEGARVLLRHGEQLESAAVVAYEHHLRQDGSGYPRLSYPREPHLLTRVVAVCGAFDALLAHRPDRTPMEPSLALREIERNAVSQFDPRVVAAFAEVMLNSARRGSPALTLRQI
ncbi:MAG TPA: HD domain-containing phosphohydrolase, partial [Gemmatimonadales bacterium]|nr:HD domain-containing phosphohydrolase [Gemmatimonadales bacterium]